MTTAERLQRADVALWEQLDLGPAWETARVRYARYPIRRAAIRHLERLIGEFNADGPNYPTDGGRSLARVVRTAGAGEYPSDQWQHSGGLVE